MKPKNKVAISGVIAGVAYGVKQGITEYTGSEPTLDKGGDVVYKSGQEPRGIINASDNNIGLANKADALHPAGTIVNYSHNPFTSNFWSGFFKEGGFISDVANTIPGMNSMSVMHYAWMVSLPVLALPPFQQVSIIPAIGIEYCIISPSFCGAVFSAQETGYHKPEFYN